MGLRGAVERHLEGRIVALIDATFDRHFVDDDLFGEGEGQCPARLTASEADFVIVVGVVVIEVGAGKSRHLDFFGDDVPGAQGVVLAARNASQANRRFLIGRRGSWGKGGRDLVGRRFFADKRPLLQDVGPVDFEADEGIATFFFDHHFDARPELDLVAARMVEEGKLPAFALLEKDGGLRGYFARGSRVLGRGRITLRGKDFA